MEGWARNSFEDTLVIENLLTIQLDFIKPVHHPQYVNSSPLQIDKSPCYLLHVIIIANL